MYNVEKRTHTLIPCGLNTARLLKYVFGQCSALCMKNWTVYKKKEHFEGKLTENLVKLKHIGKALEKAKILAPQKFNICFNAKGIVEDFKNCSEKFAKKKIR